MAHRLNWKYGQPGKGLVDSQGNVHTWRVDTSEGPHHSEYSQLHNVKPNFMFMVEPDGFIHDGGISYQNTTGHPDQDILGEIQQAAPNLHQNDEMWGDHYQDEFELPPEPPPSQHSQQQGPDLNFVLGHNEGEDYAQMLKQWLDDLTPAEPAAPISLHHQSPQDIVPKPPVSPSAAPSQWPPGHVPDWAEPVTAARTMPEPLPEDETTEGGWLRENEALIERTISPEAYDEALDKKLAKSAPESKGPWLKRLFRRR